jgi:hypothetical protein
MFSAWLTCRESYRFRSLQIVVVVVLFVADNGHEVGYLLRLLIMGSLIQF